MKFTKILIAIVVVIATLTVGIVYAFERVASYVTITSAETSYEIPVNTGATEVFTVTNDSQTKPMKFILLTVGSFPNYLKV